MHTEPHEIRLHSRPNTARTVPAQRRTIVPHSAPIEVDQAFADFDGSHPTGPPADAISEIKHQQHALVSNLVSQLAALDRQRHKLSQLLDEIQPAANGHPK